jgi:hypothetical protein
VIPRNQESRRQYYQEFTTVSRLLKAVSAAAILGFLGLFASPARALTVINSGDEVDGWDIIFPSGISVLEEDAQSTLTLQTTGTFTSTAPQDIMFVQARYAAAATVTIDSENLTNLSGANFSGFSQKLVTLLPGTGASPPAFTQAFTLNRPSANKFTNQTLSSILDALTGSLANDATSKLGGTNGGALVINGNPALTLLKKVFYLQETPIPVVPIPAASWTGLSGLLGLWVISGIKKWFFRTLRESGSFSGSSRSLDSIWCRSTRRSTSASGRSQQ